jgi:hypothetical protein
MTWVSEAITPGEIDALKTAAAQAWADDTCYPRWKGSSFGGGQCYVTSVWLTERLGGFVGKKDGHFAWLSPDQSYILDLTGGHTGKPVFDKNSNYVKYDIIKNKRTETFNKRANFIFDNLSVAIKLADTLTGDAFPGEEPQRQNDIDSQYIHDEPNRDGLDEGTQEYNFFYANGSMEVSPVDTFGHEDLARHLNVSEDHAGPMASGSVSVQNNVATWDVYSNVNLKVLSRIFKDYSDQVGWDWGGINDVHGQVVSKSLKPKPKPSKLNYVWSNGHLYIGKTSHTALAINAEGKVLSGVIELTDKKAKIIPAYLDAMPQFFEWANDQGFKLYGSSNNLIKRYEDMEQENLGKPDGGNFNPVEGDGDVDTISESQAELGVHECPICDEIFPDWHLYEKHRREEHGQKDVEIEEHGNFPDPDMDATNPDHFTEQQPTTMPVYGMTEAARIDGFDKYAKAFKFNDKDTYYVAYLNGSPVGYAVISDGYNLKMAYSSVKRKGVAKALVRKIKHHYGYVETGRMAHDWEPEVMRKGGWVQVSHKKWVYSAGQEAKDVLTDPVPFIYDIPADTITVGHPGQRTSDIPGKFTPAGIVEGMYEPGGTVNITTMTTMPYTVNHILTLWYYQYPEFSVKRVNLIDAEGKTTKLASK